MKTIISLAALVAVLFSISCSDSDSLSQEDYTKKHAELMCKKAVTECKDEDGAKMYQDYGDTEAKCVEKMTKVEVSDSATEAPKTCYNEDKAEECMTCLEGLACTDVFNGMAKCTVCADVAKCAEDAPDKEETPDTEAAAS